MRLLKLDINIVRYERVCNIALQMAMREAERMYFLHQIDRPFNKMPRAWRIKLIRKMLPCAEVYAIANPRKK